MTAAANRQRAHSNPTFEAQFGYARAVRTGRWIHVSGTAATEADGRVTPGGAGPQAERCLAIIQAALAELGGSLQDVVRTRMYLTDINDYQTVGAVHQAAFAEVRPASTLVAVSALIDPAMLVEIEADALLADVSEAD